MHGNVDRGADSVNRFLQVRLLLTTASTRPSVNLRAIDLHVQYQASKTGEYFSLVLSSVHSHLSLYTRASL
jgi:hypothetical protein